MTDYLVQIAAASAALSVLLGLFGYAIMLERRRWDARLQTFVSGTGYGSTLAIATPLPTRPPASRRLIGISPLQLVQAGMSITARQFLMIQLTTVGLGLTVAWFLSARFAWTGLELLAALAVGFGLGLAIPRMVVRVKRSRRLTRFEGQFANALDSLASATEVGLSISQSIEAVSRDMPAPLGPEFAQVLRGLGMGLPLSEALDQLAARVPLRDVDIFVAAVSIQYRTGGGLSQILHKLASTVRERVNMRSEIRALTAQQRFSAYLLGALPIVLALILKFVSPAYFALLLQPGVMRLLVIGAVVGIVAGFFSMLRIADIEV
jgi:tight adherence protein B